MGRFFRWWRMLRPPRTIRPTKEGWWFLFATLGLGFAAINTGNNLLYLLLSMLLGTIVVSGILSEQCLKRLRLYLAAPREPVGGTPAAGGAPSPLLRADPRRGGPVPRLWEPLAARQRPPPGYAAKFSDALSLRA